MCGLSAFLLRAGGALLFVSTCLCSAHTAAASLASPPVADAGSPSATTPGSVLNSGSVTPMFARQRQPGTFSVVVRDVPVERLLFALARDSGADIVLRPGLTGRVTLNVHRRPLEEIVHRIAEQADLSVERQGSRWVVAPDLPVLRHYPIDYVNMERHTRAAVSISTSIGSAGTGAGESNSSLPNASSSQIENLADSQVWKTLENSLRQLLGDVEVLRDGESEPAPASPSGTTVLILNAEAGLVSVKATRKQHREIEQLLAALRAGLGRQVLIEATMVEVQLDREHQSGVDWNRIVAAVGDGLSLSQSLVGNAFGAGPVTSISYRAGGESGSRFAATLRLLESYGRTRILSSPRVTALNNQMALLKVVDEKVYFEIRASRTQSTNSEPSRVDYSSNVKSVPIGVMLSVIPQIGADGIVSLNIRPTISRITSYKTDPAGVLLGSPVDNLVPEVQVREIESTLRLTSGETAILGGLMQESASVQKHGVPVLMDLPLVGRLFSYRQQVNSKTELVIFLRPTVLQHDVAQGPVPADVAGPSPAFSAKAPLFASAPADARPGATGRVPEHVSGYRASLRSEDAADAPAGGHVPKGLDPSLLDD